MLRHAVFPLTALCCAAQPVLHPEGHWAGAIQLPGQDLAIQVALSSGASWAGCISIPAQGLSDAPLSEVTVQGDRIAFRMVGIPGDPRFEGRLGDGVIQGTFAQGSQSFPFRLARSLAPLAPKAPQGVRERELRFGKAPFELPGALSLPEGKGPWPVLVLVHGSGAHDRDERIGPNAPFRDLAWGLASRGIAVFRYEKRTKANPRGFVEAYGDRFTVQEEVVADAVAAATLMGSQPELDGRRIFLLGHSLGGYCLPRIAAQRPSVAGFVFLAAPSRNLEDIYLAQMQYLGVAEGPLADVRAQVSQVKALKPGTPQDGLLLGLPAAYWLDLKAHDPVQEARNLPQPLLFLQGERDYQVTREDLDGWRSGLAGKAGVHYRLFPGLNHLFIRGEGRPGREEYSRAGQVDGAVLDEISGWIKGPSAP